MRKRLHLMICSVLVLICLITLWNWYKQVPTPTHITASAMGGYYEDAFLLELSVPEAGQIYYTTDGSYPTIHSEAYTDGIWIYDRSSEPNVYNSIQNVVPDWKNYIPDPTPVIKGTVIRAVFINCWGKESDVFTQTYFVGTEPPSTGYTLSLIFEDKDIFGTDGIYVTGADYDLWYVSGQTGVGPEMNFYQKTKVPVIVELMDASGDVMLQSMAIRIQGNSSVSYAKKRFALFAETEFGPSNIFSHQIFPNTDTHSVMLKNTIGDLIVSDLVQDRSVSLQKNIPVRVFLNGEYWYDTYLLERFDKQYFQNYYGVNDILLVKDSQQEKSTDRSLQTHYDEFMDWVEESDFSQPDQYELLQKKMDVQSYIDFFCINHYLCNLDWSEKANCVLWCSTEDTGSGYEDMRWRWCIYDMDNLTDAADLFGTDQIAQVDTFATHTPWINSLTNEQPLYLALRANPQFCHQFVISFMDILNNNFSVDKTQAALRKYTTAPSSQTLSYDWLYLFFQERSAYAAEHLAQEFQLTGTLETVLVNCDDSHMGTVVVNTSQIDLTDGSWSGKYFSDYPITLTASANAGYKFVGWKGDVQSTENSISVPVDGGVSLEAVFAKIK